MTSSPHTRLWTLVLPLLLLAACGGGSGGDDAKPAPQQEKADSSTPSPLAQGVVIRVAIDENGNDLSETAHLRSLAQAIDAKDGKAIEQAWISGRPAPAAVSGDDELDRDTSTQSWQDYRAADNYQSYQPTSYLGSNTSNSYSYNYSTSTTRGAYRYYVYNLPSCGQNCGYPLPSASPSAKPSTAPGQTLDSQLKSMLSNQGIKPIADSEFKTAPAVMVQLGRKLFNDPVLSGRNNTTCATCHIPELGTTLRMSLGPTLSARTGGGSKTTDLLPRNSPSLFNRGHDSYTKMFWDSRVFASGSGFVTPAGSAVPQGLNSALAAQALFPLASRDEMLGCLGQTNISTPADYQSVWKAIVQRVTAKAEYQPLFAAAYPGIVATTIGIQHIANAIAAYENVAWRSTNAPFDQYLKGDQKTLTDQQKQGGIYFYGKAGCSSCHSGALQTDQQHHAIAIPQFGPGTGDGASGRADFGWARVTKNASDRYKFRTPSLRNVMLTGPYGHDGAYSSLRDMVAHYTNPANALAKWDRTQVTLPFRVTDGLLFTEQDSASARAALIQANQAPGVTLTGPEIDAIVAFLDALTERTFIP